MEAPMGEMDAAYRRLFQHKALLRDLLLCVLPPDLSATLDWDRMHAVHTNHVSGRLRQRSGDCAWLIPRKPPPRPTGPAAPAPDTRPSGCAPPETDPKAETRLGCPNRRPPRGCASCCCSTSSRSPTS